MMELRRRLMFRLIKLIPFLFAFQLAALQPVGHVNDFAHIFSEQYRMSLEGKLSQRKDVEFAVVTLPSLEGKPVESVAREIFDAWKIGKKDADNGVLFLVAMKDRNVRIEVGYGLEGVLPDGVCGRIIRNECTPSFSQGRYEEGTSRVVDALLQRVDGEGEKEQAESVWPVVLFFVALMVFWYFSRRFGGGPFPRRRFPNHFGGFSSGGFGGFGGGSGGGGGASGRF